MRRAALALLPFLALSSLATATGLSPWTAAVQHTTAAQQDLDDLRDLSAAVRDPALRAALHQELRQLDDRLEALDQSLRQAERADRASSAAQARAERRARAARCTDACLDQILVSMEQHAFDDDKLAVARIATNGKRLTAAQSAALADVLTFDEAKVDLLAELHPTLLDPQQFFTVLPVLTFSSSRERLLQRVGMA